MQQVKRQISLMVSWLIYNTYNTVKGGVNTVVPYEKLSNLYKVLKDVINKEKNKIHTDVNARMKSEGIISASMIGISLIERTKDVENKDEIISSINKKTNISICSLLRAEDEYDVTKSDSTRNRITYLSSEVETIQLIRDKMRSIM